VCLLEHSGQKEMMYLNWRHGPFHKGTQSVVRHAQIDYLAKRSYHQ
jgi:hypothetical protein